LSWLVIDAGNTAIKWARSDARGLRFVGTGIERLHQGSLADRLAAVWIVPRPSAAFGVCVADEATQRTIEEAVRSICGLGVTWFGAQRHFEGRGVAHSVALINGYTDPLQLGADRWHAMIGACAKYPDEPMVVVNAGTATTVDCLRAEPFSAAVFVGGVIAPGYDLMRESLARGTARLPLAEGRPAVHPLDTDTAIATGIHFAQIGLIENVVREFAAELDAARKEAPRLVLSGGRSRALLAPLTRSLLAERAVSAVSLEDSLVLRGVALRAHNEKGDASSLPPEPPASKSLVPESRASASPAAE
jgi:type III pantothenate kinase